jgi:uncharacterized DUF497 family protein
MRIEFDSAKHERNLRERGFGFDYAALIFDAPTLESEDGHRDYAEDRIRAIGQVGDDVLVVIYTIRHDARRIISARRANRKERRLWQSSR